jgi:hypothetical protein
MHHQHPRAFAWGGVIEDQKALHYRTVLGVFHRFGNQFGLDLRS